MTHISYLVGNSVLCVFQNSKYSLKNIHHKKEMVSLIPSKPTLTVLKKGDLMESNEPTVGRKILRYSSLQVKGGIGWTNNSFCCLDPSEKNTGVIFCMVTLPNMTVNTSAAEWSNKRNLVITIRCVAIKSYNLIKYPLKLKKRISRFLSSNFNS